MEDSIFTKIIKGEIPSHTVYEDEKVIAFLDINPTRYGHTLVIPKIQIDQYIDLPDEDYAALWAAVKKIAFKLRETLGTQRVGVVIKGVDVPHAHVHLLPFNEGQHLSKDAESPKLTHEDLVALSQKLRLE